MKRHVLVVSIALLAVIVLTGRVQADATVEFWISEYGSQSPILSSLDVEAGSTFDLSVWYQPDPAWEHNAWEVMLAFDRATGMGTGYTGMDNKITLNGTEDTAVSNVLNLGTKLATTLGGARGESSITGERPYGIRVSYATIGMQQVTQSGPTKLFDISLQNNMAAGETYTVLIYNYGAGSSWTSYVNDISLTKARDNFSFTVNSIAPVPEPASLAVLGTGLIGIATFAVRRRR